MLLKYECILEAVLADGISPHYEEKDFSKRNLLANGMHAHSIKQKDGTYQFSLESINFPKFKKEQVENLGKLIYNLNTRVTNRFFPGSISMEENSKIEKILVVARDAQKEWLSLGLSKCLKNDLKNFKKIICDDNGKILEYDEKSENELHERLAKRSKEIIVNQRRKKVIPWRKKRIR